MSRDDDYQLPPLKPFFCYYGGKWRAAKKYPSPIHDTIIEPFAGAAGYSTRYPDHKVILYDTDEKIVGMWRYLISVSPSEILSLPIVGGDQSVDDFRICEESKWLIGFWLNKGSSQPCKRPSRWMRDGTHPRSFWGEDIRARIASQVVRIRHWEAFLKSYKEVDNREATWFIDPPYQDQGRHYKHGASAIDFSHLGEWSKQRDGQVIVCEQDGADWLPFVPLGSIKGTSGNGRRGSSMEAVYVQE